MDFFTPRSGCKHSNTNSYNFAMTLISRNDHLTAGAWAAYGIVNNLSVVLVCSIAEYFKSLSVLSLPLRARQNTAQRVNLGRWCTRQIFVYFAKRLECH